MKTINQFPSLKNGMINKAPPIKTNRPNTNFNEYKQKINKPKPQQIFIIW